MEQNIMHFYFYNYFLIKLIMRIIIFTLKIAVEIYLFRIDSIKIKIIFIFF